MKPRISVSVLVPVFVGTALASTAAGQADLSSLDNVAFMSGCWEGVFGSEEGDGVIEEHYTTPSRNLMLGTTRYLVGGRTIQFELTVIEITEDDRVLLVPYPRGKRSEDAFRLTAADGTRAVFEAPEHDFPKRIIYERVGADTLRATIDDGAGGSRAIAWTLGRKACQ